MALTGVKITKTDIKDNTSYIGQIYLAGRRIMTMSSAFDRTYRQTKDLMRMQDKAFRKTIIDINASRRIRVRANSYVPVIDWGGLDFRLTTGTDVEGDRWERSMRIRATITTKRFAGKSKGIYDFELDELIPDLNSCAAMLSNFFGTTKVQVAVPEGEIAVELITGDERPAGTA